MYPWLWLWFPQWNFPFSGSVAQRIEPDTNWFFGAIDPTAGNGRVERRAFEAASYGRQLGLITEVLLDIASKSGELSGPAQESKARLEQISAQIESIKQEEAGIGIEEIEARLSTLKKANPRQFEAIRTRLADFIRKES